MEVLKAFKMAVSSALLFRRKARLKLWPLDYTFFDDYAGATPL